MRVLIIYILMLGLTPLYGQQRTPAAVDWLSFEQLNDSLAQNPKPVVLFFHTDWCHYCKEMLRETFHHPEVVHQLNANYYAVKFDAERVDTVYFDQVAFTNTSQRKTAGQYHALAKILIGEGQQPIFPVTILLDDHFSVREKVFNYLSIRQLLDIL